MNEQRGGPSLFPLLVKSPRDSRPFKERARAGARPFPPSKSQGRVHLPVLLKEQRGPPCKRQRKGRNHPGHPKIIGSLPGQPGVRMTLGIQMWPCIFEFFGSLGMFCTCLLGGWMADKPGQHRTIKECIVRMCTPATGGGLETVTTCVMDGTWIHT